MKLFWKIFLLLAIFSGPLLSDTVTLKNGNKLRGKIITEDEKQIVLKTKTAVETLKREEIKSVEIGMTGVPVCVTFMNQAEKEKCDFSLVSLTSSKAYLLSDNDNEPVGHNFKHIKSIHIKKENDSQNSIPYLKNGMEVEIFLKKGTIEAGIVKEKLEDRVILERANKTSTIYETAIASVKLSNNKAVKPIAIPYRAVVPGWAQYHRNEKVKSAVYYTLFFGITGGMAAEYLQALNSKKKAEEYQLLPLSQASTYFLYNPDYSAYNSHRQNYYALSGALFLLYAVNFWDVYRNDIRSVSFSVREEPYERREYSYHLNFSFKF